METFVRSGSVMPMPSLMVLDGESRASLGIVRSLGRMGIPIAVGSAFFLGRSGYSRYAGHRFTYPSPKQGPEAAHQVILRRVKALRPDILMPVMDPGWSVVRAFEDAYAGLTTIVPNPGPDLSGRLYDKAMLADLAEQHGIPIPVTYRPETLQAAEALGRFLPYPVLLKPRRSVAGYGIRPARDPREFLDALRGFASVPIIQECLEGEDLELTLFCDMGRPLAGSAYVSLRNAPLPYGPPVACRTLQDKAFMRMGAEFLERIGYHGVAHMDFRRDRRDGIPKLLDFNPRIAGTNDISIRSGVNFARMQYSFAAGGQGDPVFDYQEVREYRWMVMGELKHLAQTPHRLQTIRELLRFRGATTDVSFRDPMPHLARAVQGILWRLEQHRAR